MHCASSNFAAACNTVVHNAHSSLLITLSSVSIHGWHNNSLAQWIYSFMLKLQKSSTILVALPATLTNCKKYLHQSTRHILTLPYNYYDWLKRRKRSVCCDTNTHICIWFRCTSCYYLFIPKYLMISSFDCITEPCQLLPEKEKEKQCLEQCTCFSARVIFYLCENTIVLTYNDRQIQVCTKVLLLLQHILWYEELCTSIFTHWYWVLHFYHFLW